jgi:hypothetical protein
MNQRSKIAILLIVFAICGTAAIVHRWYDVRRVTARPNELYEIVWQQIEAFQGADFSRAYQQVSTGFQERFNVETFAELVRTEYPAIALARRVEFGSVRFAGRNAVLQVYFILPDGEVVPCLYGLVFEDGTWKIDGARFQKRWPAGRRLGGMRS